MAERTKPILCVGALTLDTIFQMPELPAEPGKFLPIQAVQNAAGMASSAATSISRLGGAVSLWASVGDDATGQRLIDEVSAEGVDCTSVRRVEGTPSAFATILVDLAGERVIVPHYDPALLAAPVDIPAITADKYVAVMTDVRWPAAAALALAAAKRAGIPAILDVDTAAMDVLEMLLPLATHIVASEPAAYLATGQDEPMAATRALAARHEAFIAITAGANGIYWFDAASQAVRHRPAHKIVAVDTLAAGDVFHGAFALGLVEGMAMTDIMAFAATAAAIKCETFGGRRGAPRRNAVIERMALG